MATETVSAYRQRVSCSSWKCWGAVTVESGDNSVTLTVDGACGIAGPPDDGDPTPNSRTVVVLTTEQVSELITALINAGRPPA